MMVECARPNYDPEYYHRHWSVIRLLVPNGRFKSLARSLPAGHAECYHRLGMAVHDLMARGYHKFRREQGSWPSRERQETKGTEETKGASVHAVQAGLPGLGKRR
jgi:hypothetical protein